MKDKEINNRLGNLWVAIITLIIVMLIFAYAIITHTEEIRNIEKNVPHKVCWNETIYYEEYLSVLNYHGAEGSCLINVKYEDYKNYSLSLGWRNGLCYVHIYDKKCNWQDNKGNVLFVYEGDKR